jgi:hypothetical protein
MAEAATFYNSRKERRLSRPEVNRRKTEPDPGPLERMDGDNNVPTWLKPWTPELGTKANAPMALFARRTVE